MLSDPSQHSMRFDCLTYSPIHLFGQLLEIQSIFNGIDFFVYNQSCPPQLEWENVGCIHFVMCVYVYVNEREKERGKAANNDV